MNDYQFIFIGGAPRSGTTLVQRLLNAHPEVYGGPEFDMLPEVVALRNRFVRRIENGRIDRFFDTDYLDTTFKKFLCDLFAEKIRRERVRFLSEKTPANILVFPELTELFPEASFVFVVRDPRATVASMLEVGKKTTTPPFTQDLISAVRYMNQCLEGGLSLGSRTITIRYEDLVSQGENQAAWLFRILGLPDAEVSLRDAKYDRSQAGKEREVWFTREQLEGGVYASSLDKWRQTLSSTQVKYIERNCVFPGLTDTYYQPPTGRPWHRDIGFNCQHWWNLAKRGRKALAKRLGS